MREQPFVVTYYLFSANLLFFLPVLRHGHECRFVNKHWRIFCSSSLLCEQMGESLHCITLVNFDLGILPWLPHSLMCNRARIIPVLFHFHFHICSMQFCYVPVAEQKGAVLFRFFFYGGCCDKNHSIVH